MRFLLLLVCALFVLLPSVGNAQYTSDEFFTDGDFTSNPTWVGEAVNYTVNGSNQLQTNGPAVSDTAYLSLAVPFNPANTWVWEFYLNLNFNPSNSNNARIFLLSDQADLEGSLNGYFIRIGENGATDRMKLYKQQGTTPTLLATGNVSTFGTTPDATFRVTRDAAGNWDLYSDTLAGTNYTLEASVQNTDIVAGTHFGLFSKYTGANSTAFIYDDFSIAEQGDTTAPAVDTLLVTATNELKVIFNEAMDLATAQNVANYASSLLGAPATAVLVQDTCVTLTFGSAFVIGTSDTLFVANVTDTAGNVLPTDTLLFTINYPTVATAGAVVFNEIFADPTPQVALPNNEFLELFNNSPNAYDLSGWTLVNTTTNMVLSSFVLQPDSFLIVCAIGDTLDFQPLGATMGLAGWAALVNGGDSLTLLDAQGTIIDLVTYDISWYNDAVKDDGGWSLELINPTPGPCAGGTQNNWTASNDVSGGTPGVENSVFGSNVDITAPEFTSIAIDGATTITLLFNEVMDSTSLANGTYTIDNGLTATNVALATDLLSVTLTLSAAIDTGTVYTVTVTGVTDCPGNAIAAANTQTFVIAEPAAPGAVVFNELFADPTPPVALPGVEWIEIRNASANAVDLTGWELVNTSTVMALSAYVLEPDSFLILCANADTASLSPFGEAMGLSSWAGLTNGGDSLTLLDSAGVVINNVSYDISWYNDAVKDDGGWSLELINPTPGPCLGATQNNWTASNDVAGGTPGTENSVFGSNVDITAPEFTSITIDGATTITLVFDELMDSTSLANGTYTIDNGLTATNVALATDLLSVTLTLSAAIDTGTVYTVSVTGVTDCPGNAIATANTQTFVIAQPAAPGAVVFNEIFADPSPQVALPTVEWIEIHNASATAVDLAGWELVNTTTAMPLNAYALQPDSFLILCEDADTASLSPFGAVMGLSSFSALTNGGDSLSLLDSTGVIIDVVSYDISWYNDAIKDDGGWSLELIDPTPGSCITTAALNWTASNDVSGGTPGTQNSVWDTVPDVIAPDLTAVNIISPIALQLTFSEAMDSTSLANGTYNISGGIGVTNVLVSFDFLSATLTMSPAIDSGTVYTITVTGVSDCPGNSISANNSDSFIISAEPGPGDVIFTEIFADPFPVLTLPDQEYVEVYNTTNQILDLSTCSFEGVSFPAGAQIDPNAYAILCDDGDSTLFAPFGSVIAFGAFPSLTNGGEDLVLINSQGEYVDSLFYDISWYNDVVKADGGWSLELINPQYPCPGDVSGNWTASQAAFAGTPGVQNSVFDTLPDLTAPELISATVLGPMQLQLGFNELMDSTTLANGLYSVSNGLTVVSVEVDSTNFTVVLNLNTTIDSGITQSVMVTNVTDCQGNAIGINNALSFTIGFVPGPGNIVINEIMADPSPTVALPDVEYLELYNTTNMLFELSGASVSSSFIPVGTQLPANGYLILCPIADTAQFSGFGAVVGISSWNSLTNGGELLELRGPDSTLLDAVNYDISWYQDANKDDGGWSLERINPETPCSGADNWIASVATNGGSPGAQNTVYDTTPDTNAPTVAGSSILSANQLLLTFSELMDSVSLATGSYTVDNGLTVFSVIIDPNNLTQILLTFSTNIDTAQLYTLTINGLSDCAGNTIAANTQHPFIIGFKPVPGEIVVNEIMADPTPVVGLPEVEYVELLNTGNRLLDLTNATFEGSEFAPGTLIQPNGYLLLLSDDDAIEYDGSSPLAVFDSWSTLTNDGEDLVLQLQDGTIIDSLTYDISWYGDPALDGGGYSLERVNPFAACSFGNNWRASIDASGGTPLFPNSVFSTAPDVVAPTLLSATVVAADQVLLTFSEGMDSASVATGTYVFSNSIFTQNVEVQANLTQVLITLNNDLDTAVWYTVTAGGMLDCPGNVIGTPDTASFVIGYRPEPGDVYFNEMMLDPTPPVGLPEEEYIELYNTTNRLLDLSNCEYDGANFPANTFIDPNGYLILADDEAAALFEEFGTVAAIGSWQTLTNAGEEIVLQVEDGAILDVVSYTDDWYFDPAKTDGGWSIERVNPFTDCNFGNNWRASVADSGGTPGAINSVYSTAPDTIPPGVSGVTVVEDDLIIVHFTETMDSLSLTTGTYSLLPDVGVFAFTIDTIDFDHVEILLNNSLEPSTIYTVFVDDVFDCEGTAIGTANAFDFVLPEQGNEGDIILNEVLFNPVTGGSDFVEVYNNSQKNIDLANWKLATIDVELDTIDNARTITEDQYIIGPGEYATLTRDQTLWLIYRGGTFVLEAFDSDLKDQYPGAVVETFINMPTMPTYANDEGTVVLINNQDTVMDRFDYLDDYHYALLNSDDGVSLERIDFDRPTNDPTNWHSASEQENFATPGYENSQYQPTDIVDADITIDPEIFSPDNDGFNDVVHINYRFDAPGFTGSVQIYDARGRLMRTLLNNALLDPEGTVSWDGITDDNEKARIGIYIIFFEAFDLDGKVVRFKEKCVLGGMIGN